MSKKKAVHNHQTSKSILKNRIKRFIINRKALANYYKKNYLACAKQLAYISNKVIKVANKWLYKYAAKNT